MPYNGIDNRTLIVVVGDGENLYVSDDHSADLLREGQRFEVHNILNVIIPPSGSDEACGLIIFEGNVLLRGNFTQDTNLQPEL